MRGKKSEFLRLGAEVVYKKELDFLKKNDNGVVPLGWKMSPKAVLKYIIGGEFKGKVITPKYIGNDRAVEIAISTLLTDRALLLIGDPGTAKSWLSEHLTAAIYGDSTKTIQGTLGTTEEQIKYSWNYGMLISNGPSEEALIKSPVFKAMEEGGIARFEEISRCPSEVQDALISLLSEKRITIPEISKEILAKRGFSLIATANTKDKGVNSMSTALKRRFNIVKLKAPNDIEIEIEIVKKRVFEQMESLNLKGNIEEDSIRKILIVFRELREGELIDRNEKIKSVSGVLSTAEAISIISNCLALSTSFGDGNVSEKEIAASLQGAIIKDDIKDVGPFNEYLENVMKKRDDSWIKLYKAFKELN